MVLYDHKEVDLNYCTLSNEDEPHHTCKSKNFMKKLILLAAVTRPGFDIQENVTFSESSESLLL